MPELVIEARKAFISEQLSVRRILPFRKRRMVGPFIFMDHAGPVNLPPKDLSAMDVLPHPHIGLSTVSYLLGGAVMHRDGLGVEQEIKPGEVNWMTAGSGISHSERFEDPDTLAQGSFEMLQTWVALPVKAEESAPEFTNYKPAQMPLVEEGGLWMRLIAGEAYGLHSPVKTHSPLFYIHARLQRGARLQLPQGHAERAVYVVHGEVELAGARYKAGQMLVFSKGASPVVTAAQDSTLMLLGGEPVGERFIWWNFVSSSKERIEQAKADWKAGRIVLPPTDNKEFIPLPESKGGPAGTAPAPEVLS